MKNHFLLLFLLINAAFGAIDLNEVPKKWRKYIELEFKNAEKRKSITLPLDHKDNIIREIYHYQVPLDDAFVITTESLEKENIDFAIETRDGRKWLNVFFDPTEFSGKSIVSDLPHENNFKHISYWIRGITKPKRKVLDSLASDPPKSILKGIKIQGHSSYFVWDPKKPENSPMFLKTNNWAGHNDGENLRNGVHGNTILEKIYNHTPNSQKFHYLPEKFVATVGKKGTYSYLLRSVEPEGGLPKGSYMVPLHGLLDKDYWEQKTNNVFAFDSFMREELVPKLAKFHAQLNFTHGIYVEGHGQNLFAILDEKTDKIIDIGFRDISDVMFDPHIRLSQGKRLFYNVNPNLKPHSIVNENFVDGKLNHRPGIHSWSYSSQAYNPFMNHFRSIKFSDIFLNYYLREAERIKGGSINLTTQSEEALANLKAALSGKTTVKRTKNIGGKKIAYFENIKEAENLDDQNIFKRIQKAVAYTVQDIYQQMSKHYLFKINRSHFDYDQKYLKHIFGSKRNTGHIVHLTPVEDFDKKRFKFIPKKYTYGFDGTRVFAFDKDRKIVISYTMDLNEFEQKSIQANQLSSCAQKGLRALLK